ncbi:MAG: nucleoside triphosphate pyrophosphohydrolase [Candidatus Krumholzibacteria bacterium]|nr:nucleoside triphosphate pyrophosphohydrolase [Candidatus Krumholzibacteria bacterium]
MPSDSLQTVLDLIGTLRGPGGCPWDRAQSLEDILSDLVEEAYELEWAAARHGDAETLDEMGDVLFLLCFAVSVKRETNPSFTLDAIAGHAHEKIKSRHPHVFGDETAATPEESIAHWERAKARERAAGPGAGALAGVAGNLPPLRHAQKIQQRAASVGFDWERTEDIVAKIREELAELEDALRQGAGDAIRHEVGDLLFSVVNVARFLRIDSEAALVTTTSRFVRRFEALERLIADDGRRLSDMTLAEMDVYWERVKSSD